MKYCDLFNRNRDGAREIVSAVGMISGGISFDVWEPLLPLGMRELEAIVGREPLDAISEIYNDDMRDIARTEREIIRLAQQAIACFTWLRVIPTLDAQHDVNGRSRRLGENEKGLSALQEFKDEQNILRLAYEATDALIALMERSAFTPWLDSPKSRMRAGLLIGSKEEFDGYYHIGSHRLFVTLLPIIRELQTSRIAPVLGKRHLQEILSDPEGEEAELLREPAARALALLTMQKAVERLPVEVIPEGVVQVQQQQTVKQRIKAEPAARAAVAASLGADAARYLESLQGLVAELDARGREIDRHIPGPIVHSRGMSF